MKFIFFVALLMISCIAFAQDTTYTHLDTVKRAFNVQIPMVDKVVLYKTSFLVIKRKSTKKGDWMEIEILYFDDKKRICLNPKRI